MLVGQILNYVKLTKLSSIMKRSSTVLTSWNVWVTLLIRDEESNYIQLASHCCTVKRGIVPSVLEAVHAWAQWWECTLQEWATISRWPLPAAMWRGMILWLKSLHIGSQYFSTVRNLTMSMCPVMAAWWSGVYLCSSRHDGLQPCSSIKYLTMWKWPDWARYVRIPKMDDFWPLYLSKIGWFCVLA